MLYPHAQGGETAQNQSSGGDLNETALVFLFTEFPLPKAKSVLQLELTSENNPMTQKTYMVILLVYVKIIKK